jgi:CheY-like chemotaxis protein
MTKILYVEDTPASQRLVQRILAAEGFMVTVANDGISAIELARDEKPDLILMDINIGGLDGYEVTTRLRSIDGLEKTPIVAVTAATLSGDRERALVAGCNGYIAKPMTSICSRIRCAPISSAWRTGSAPPKRKPSTYSSTTNGWWPPRGEGSGIGEGQPGPAAGGEDEVGLRGAGRARLRTRLTVVYGYLQILLANPAIPGAHEEEGSPHTCSRRSPMPSRDSARSSRTFSTSR